MPDKWTDKHDAFYWCRIRRGYCRSLRQDERLSWFLALTLRWGKSIENRTGGPLNSFFVSFVYASCGSGSSRDVIGTGILLVLVVH